MIVVHHRRNTIEELSHSDPAWGVEIDLRNHGNDILVAHDPFDTDAVSLDDWLDHYRHRFLIANVKEEGLEPQLLPLLEHRGITDFFILDESFPFIRKYALEGISEFAIRVSELESEDTALRLADMLDHRQRRVGWIWIDTFSGEAPEPEISRRLRQAGYRLCAVSPELHHVTDVQSWEQRIDRYQSALRATGAADVWPDMICTKRPDLWSRVGKS